MSRTNAETAPVLIVEDEALVAMMVEDTLAGAGYRSVRAPNGRAAAQAAVVGLRCADGLDGRQVVRRLREQNPSMPVVVVTGFDLRAPEADLRGLGGPVARVGKPFDRDEFLACLAGVLDAHQAAATRTGPRRRASPDDDAATGPTRGWAGRRHPPP